MPCQSIQHLINEWPRIVILSGSSIQLSVISSDLPSSYSSCRNQLIPFIFDPCHPTLLGKHMTRAYPSVVVYAYIMLAFSHLRTSFFTTCFIIGFNILWCSIEVLAFSSMRIFCIQIVATPSPVRFGWRIRTETWGCSFNSFYLCYY